MKYDIKRLFCPSHLMMKLLLLYLSLVQIHSRASILPPCQSRFEFCSTKRHHLLYVVSEWVAFRNPLEKEISQLNTVKNDDSAPFNISSLVCDTHCFPLEKPSSSFFHIIHVKDRIIFVMYFSYMRKEKRKFFCSHFSDLCRLFVSRVFRFLSAYRSSNS